MCALSWRVPYVASSVCVLGVKCLATVRCSCGHLVFVLNTAFFCTALMFHVGEEFTTVARWCSYPEVQFLRCNYCQKHVREHPTPSPRILCGPFLHPFSVKQILTDIGTTLSSGNDNRQASLAEFEIGHNRHLLPTNKALQN